MQPARRLAGRAMVLRSGETWCSSRSAARMFSWASGRTRAFTRDFVYSRATSQSDPFMQSAARLNQAAIAIARKEWQTALNALEESVRLQLPRPQAGILAGGLTGLAHIAIEQSLPELASRLLSRAQSISSAGAPLPPYIIPIADVVVPPLLPAPHGRTEAPIADQPGASELFDEALAAISTAMNPVEIPRKKKGVGALTPREIEVLCLVAEDKTDQEIADILFRSPRTVNDHMTNIIGKLGVYSRTGAVVRALVEHWCD